LTGKKRSIRILIVTALLVPVLILLLNMIVLNGGIKYIVEAGSFSGAHTAIVPGAYVYPDGRLCDMLVDRLETAILLYRQGKVKKILMTGDHGLTSYDEVNSMRKYAESRGIPATDVFMDHAGFCTYDSMFRAREVFQVDSAVIITQNFHLPRAVYIARQLGLPAVGLSADRHIYAGSEVYDLREIPARVKAFAQVAFNDQPRFLGPVISISGDGRSTHDYKE